MGLAARQLNTALRSASDVIYFISFGNTRAIAEIKRRERFSFYEIDTLPVS